MFQRLLCNDLINFFSEIEGLDSIHKVLSRKNLMCLANMLKEIFIVV